MDDLIKLLAELANRQPKPKGGGIVDTAEGIEFIGRKLTKQEAGDYALINSKLTDATRFTPFSIRKLSKTPLTNPVPLSLTKTLGNPWTANNLLKTSMAFLESVDLTVFTSTHFECASTTTRKIFPLVGPA